MRPFRRSEPGAPRASATFASGAGLLVVSRYVVAAMGWAGTVLVVHALSPEGWGGYSLIFAVLGLVSLVTSLRLGRVVTSDILTAGEESGQVVGSYLTMRLVLGAISYVVAVSVVAA